MPSREKPEKHKPEKLQPDSTQPELLRPGLERRLHTAKSKKSAKASKSVAIKTLAEKIKTDNQKFSLASITIIEFEHAEKTFGAQAAGSLEQAIEAEIVAQLRQDDLVAARGRGRFFIYLPDTAKLESKMVLDRLSRQLCTKNSQRAVMPQVSISYGFISTQTVKESESFLLAQEQLQEKLHKWLARYRFAEAVSFGKESGIKANDSWSDMKEVMVRRLDIPAAASAETRGLWFSVVSLIQEEGLALHPKLIDFFFDSLHVYLVLEPTADCPGPFLQDDKTIHALAISLCDLFLRLVSLSSPVVPANLSAAKFKITKASNEIVIDELDAHLIEGLIRSCNFAESIKNLADLFRRLAGKNSTEECFAQADDILKKVLKSFPANENKDLDLAQAKGNLQKIRSIFKRHEEKIRRNQSASAGEK